MKLNSSKTTGFTLAEMVVSLGVLALIVLFSFSIYNNFFDAMRHLKANNLVYEEARFLMNRMVQEVRNGTIDYEEYFNQSKLRNQFSENYTYLRNETYAQNYCEYSRQFYTLGEDGEIGTLDDKNTGERNLIDPADGITQVPPAIGILNALNEDVATPLQNDLFLINVSGNERTYIKRIEGMDALGNTIGQVGILKLEGKDFGVDHLNAFDPNLDGSAPAGTCVTDSGEGDGRIDTWVCAEGFPCQRETFINAELCSGVVHKVIYDPSLPADSSFVPISPNTLDVLDLQFIVTPMDDPRKAYKNNDLQIQPSVTLKMTVQVAESLTRQLQLTRQSSLSLDSTVSTRIYSEIITECNLKQCTPGVSADKSCPLTAGVCGPAVLGNPSASQSCVDHLWEGCTADTYQTFADTTYGLDLTFPGGAQTYYENGSEYQSCQDDLTSCTATCLGDALCEAACETTANTCKSHRCSDGVDNDCSGAADDADNACISSLCEDGLYDVAVEAIAGCIDVGGVCQSIHPLQNEESVCDDGLDNDCDGFADQFDANCVEQYCTNGLNEPKTNETNPFPYVNPLPTAFLNLNFTPKNYLLNAQSGDYGGTFLNECSLGVDSSPDVGGICSTCLDEATGKGICECGEPGCTNTKVVPNHEYEVSETGASCYDNLDNDCDSEADELDSDCQATLCEDAQKNCDLAPDDYSPANFLGAYNNATCQTTGPTVNDELCADVGGLCEGFSNGGVSHSLLAGEATQAQCEDGLDNDCDGGVDWADGDGSCCTFRPYCLKNNSISFFDSLETADYIDQTGVGVNHDTGAGEMSLNDANLSDVFVRSQIIPLEVSSCNTFSLSLNGTIVSTPGSSQIQFMLSADNGNTWCGDDNCSGDRIDEDELVNVVSNLSASSILWQAFLTGDGTNTPIISDVQVNFSACNP